MLYKNVKKIGYFRIDNRKYVKIWEKFLRFIRKMFIKVEFESIDNGTIILIPAYKKYNGFIVNKIIKQVHNYQKSVLLDYIIYEDKLKLFEKKLETTKILTGKYLMKKILVEIFEYIFGLNNSNMNLENVYLFVNTYNKENVYIIEKLIENFKTVNIITENLRYYKILEEKLYSQGVLITVSNNKRKSAKNAKYIVNMDFEKENFEKYNINSNSIIINLMDENLNLEKNFCGVVVNNFEIHINNDTSDFINEFYGNINKKIFLESVLFSDLKKYSNMVATSLKNKVEISALYGKRGVLQKWEFLH